MHVSYSVKIEHYVESSIFQSLNNITQNTQILRFPAFLAFGVSSAIVVSMEFCSLVENTLHGFGLILAAQFSNTSSRNWKRGCTILKGARHNVSSLCLGVPFKFIFDLISILFEPKFYIIKEARRSAILLHHIEAGTYGSSEHEEDISQLFLHAEYDLMDWQKANRENIK